MPAAEALATGKPVIVSGVDVDRYPSPVCRRLVDLGSKSACLVPLVTSNGTLGTLDIAGTTGGVCAAAGLIRGLTGVHRASNSAPVGAELPRLRALFSIERSPNSAQVERKWRIVPRAAVPLFQRSPSR